MFRKNIYKNRHIKRWMNMQAKEKKKYFSNSILVNQLVKKETQPKTFVTPKIVTKAAVIKSGVKPLGIEKDLEGSNDPEKLDILKELQFFKNNVKCDQNTVRTSKQPITHQNTKLDAMYAVSVIDNIDKCGTEKEKVTEQEKVMLAVLKDQESNKEKETYQCEVCNQRFKYLKNFNSHQLKGTCGSTLECSKCDIKLKNLKTLKNHLRNVHEKPLFQCGMCSRIFPTEKNLEKHFNYSHEEKECKFCNKMFKNANTMRSHIFNCPLKKKSLVPDSKEAAAKPAKAKVDTNKSNDSSQKADKPRKECTICKKTFQTKGGYNKHLNTHKIVNANNVLSDSMKVDDIILVLSDLPVGTHDMIQDDTTGGGGLEFVADVANN